VLGGVLASYLESAEQGLGAIEKVLLLSSEEPGREMEVEESLEPDARVAAAREVQSSCHLDEGEQKNPSGKDQHSHLMHASALPPHRDVSVVLLESRLQLHCGCRVICAELRQYSDVLCQVQTALVTLLMEVVVLTKQDAARCRSVPIQGNEASLAKPWVSDLRWQYLLLQAGAA
jgi:hypothetical protein